ncbi:MAG: immunity protein Tsi6 family protein [Polyangiaceae bacterium]
MKPALSAIKSRSQFDQVLAKTLADVRAREAAAPAYPPWKWIVQQLDAAQKWSADGRAPTKQERDKILVGTIAMRELEPTTDLALYDLCQRLHELQYYFQEHL